MTANPAVLQTRPTLIQGFARSIGVKAARRIIRRGVLRVRMPDGEELVIGDDPEMGEARMEIHSPEFFSRALFHGEIGFGEAYMDGLWTTPDLVALLYLAIANRENAKRELGKLSFFSRFRNRRRHVGRRNSKSNAERNIHDHYDLGNRFFPLFLDESLTYSCALFESDDQPLKDAQAAKYRAMCEKAGVQRGDRILEIGTGWGGFALFAAREYDCQVTTISISGEQVALARDRVREAGLEDRIDVRFQDYRDVSGEFDRIISIEMFEAVGVEYFETFFRKCDESLRPGGRMCMQVITVPDRNFAAQRGRCELAPEVHLPRRRPSLGQRDGAGAAAHESHGDADPGHREALRGDVEAVARAVLRQPRPGEGAGLRRPLRQYVGVLPRLVRGRLPRPLHHRRPDRLREAGERTRCHGPGRDPITPGLIPASARQTRRPSTCCRRRFR